MNQQDDCLTLSATWKTVIVKVNPTDNHRGLTSIASIPSNITATHIPTPNNAPTMHTPNYGLPSRHSRNTYQESSVLVVQQVDHRNGLKFVLFFHCTTLTHPFPYSCYFVAIALKQFVLLNFIYYELLCYVNPCANLPDDLQHC